MLILKIEMFSTQKSAMTLLFIDFDFFPDLQGRFGWFVNLLLYLLTYILTYLLKESKSHKTTKSAGSLFHKTTVIGKNLSTIFFSVGIL